jgi:transposase
VARKSEAGRPEAKRPEKRRSGKLDYPPKSGVEEKQYTEVGESEAMTSLRRKYTREFKLEAIRLHAASDKSQAQVERELGIPEGMLSKWRLRFGVAGEEAFPGTGHVTDVEAELRRLRRENDVLRQERDILKKAIQVFSRDGG